MRILGIDYGERKLGIAFGDFQTGLVEPLETLRITNFQAVKLRIKKIVEEREIEKIIIGIPGGEMNAKIQSFAEKLRREIGLVVEPYDETISTREANQITGLIGRSRKYKKKMEDAIAAAVMLKSYLEKEGRHV